MDKEIIRIVINGLMLIGIIIAVLQVRAALRISRANVLLRLLEEWNRKELYQAIRYIHRLRKEWKDKEANNECWPKLAKDWIEERISADPESSNELDRKRAEEWLQRRLVAQFISRMGNLLRSGYIKSDDFFNIVPEVQRLLVVLEPIDQVIINHFSTEEIPLAEWDYPFPKTAYEYISRKHEKWFHQKGKKYLKNGKA